MFSYTTICLRFIHYKMSWINDNGTYIIFFTKFKSKPHQTCIKGNDHFDLITECHFYSDELFMVYKKQYQELKFSSLQ